MVGPWESESSHIVCAEQHAWPGGTLSMALHACFPTLRCLPWPNVATAWYCALCTVQGWFNVTGGPSLGPLASPPVGDFRCPVSVRDLLPPIWTPIPGPGTPSFTPVPSASTSGVGSTGSGSFWYSPGGTALIVLFTIACTLVMVVAYHKWFPTRGQASTGTLGSRPSALAPQDANRARGDQLDQIELPVRTSGSL